MRPLSRIAPLLLLASSLALAEPNRWLVEDGTAGAITPGANPTLICGQSTATAVSQACVAGSCTRAAPTVAAEGLDLGGAKGIRLSVCAASGQTLSGAGTMRAWYYSPKAAKWMRNPGLDFVVTASGVQCQVFPDLLATVNQDGSKVIWAADAVTVSGGAALVVRHLVQFDGWGGGC